MELRIGRDIGAGFDEFQESPDEHRGEGPLASALQGLGGVDPSLDLHLTQTTLRPSHEASWCWLVMEVLMRFWFRIVLRTFAPIEHPVIANYPDDAMPNARIVVHP